jgi:hypothetical protein
MLDENGFTTYSTMLLISYIMFASINMKLILSSNVNLFLYMSIHDFPYNIISLYIYIYKTFIEGECWNQSPN